MVSKIEVGIDRFAGFDDSLPEVSPSERMQNLIRLIEHTDKVGLDIFGIGEHHRQDFLDSAPAVILSATPARKIA